jgi:diadenosine tetraphosphatase ApaH/serine/threonine PP2A family protein phosphatase
MNTPLIKLTEEMFSKFKRLLVIGDLHGDIASLNAIFSKINLFEDALLFLGDYGDRGAYSVEVIETLSSLRNGHADRVFLLKGNHEDYTELGNPQFIPCSLKQEVEKKKGDWEDYFVHELKPFIDNLSLAAIMPGNSLFVHAGISSKIKSIESLINPTADIERDILWSDPSDGLGEVPNAKRGGSGVEFGPDISEFVCRLLNVKRIIRSHEPTKALFEPNYAHDGKVVTISSTRVYRGLPFMLIFNSMADVPQTIPIF